MRAGDNITEPARVRCSAKYTTACSRITAEYYAKLVAQELGELNSSSNQQDLLSRVTNGDYNQDVGFYPFVFGRDNSTVLLAHGDNPTLVKKSIEDIFDLKQIGFSNSLAVHQRFQDAANIGGNWVSYIWSDDDAVNSKVAYIVPINDDLLLGVGYEDVPLPASLPCSADNDGWCSVTNAESLVGKAQFRLFEEQSSIEHFDALLYDISFEDAYQIGGESATDKDSFYLFLYSYSGALKAHGRLHDKFGKTLTDIIVEGGLASPEHSSSVAYGDSLHQSFMDAADSNGWVSYWWQDSSSDEPYLKVAKLSKVILDDPSVGVYEEFYLGVGYKFETQSAPKGPLGGTCMDSSNLACAISIVFQLSSHALSFAVSSSSPVDEIMTMLETEEFKEGNFYVFAYDYLETCQSHGRSPGYKGKTLSEIFDLNNITVDAKQLDQQFREAANQGGGWVSYYWVDASGNNIKKMSYMFGFNRDGTDYYGGIGLTHLRGTTQEFITLKTKDGEETELPCSAEYTWDCAEVNAKAVLGQSVAALTLARSNIQDATTSVGSVFAQINERDDFFSIGDFSASVFDGSGSCLASGQPDFVGKNWEEILVLSGANGVRGVDLHEKLLKETKPDSEVFMLDDGGSRFWASRIQGSDNDNMYAVVMSGSLDPPPLCVDGCPDSMHCAGGDQIFCLEKQVRAIDSAGVKAAISLLCFLIPVGLFIIVRQRRKTLRAKAAKQKLEAELETFRNSIVGVATAKTLYVPGDAVTEQPKEKKTRNKKKQRKNVQWCWQETAERMDIHDKAKICGDPANCWIKYDDQANVTLETAFQAQGATGDFSPVAQYSVSFDKMIQTNTRTGFTRDVQRVVGAVHDSTSSSSGLASDASFDADLSKARVAAPLPEELQGEPRLLMTKGDIVQISKKRDDGFAFGSKLHHTDEPHLRKLTAKITAGISDGEDASISADCGWFELDATEAPSGEDLKLLQKSVGNAGALGQPSGWDDVDSRTIASRLPVQPQSTEYSDVSAAFHLTKGNKNVRILQIQRVQNLAMWQSYVVKRQTICHRETNSKDGNNSSPNRELQKRFERYWLWHGTDCQTVDKILQQGFNRSFCGKNATMFGKGVYFARDSNYSVDYAEKDDRNCQYILACRVVVGEYCQGVKDALTPTLRDHKSQLLYDSTVNNQQNPSIFVTYHDAQAYPEYLIKFKQS